MRSPDAYQRRIRDVNRILLQLIPCLAVFLAGTTHAQSQAPVDIQLKEFGTGNTWRAGDTIGIRVELTSNQPGEQQYWVEWNLPTADGDTAQYGRRIALSPGQPRDLWLYGPLRPWFTGDTGMEIGVRTWEDADPGARIANLRFLPRSVGPAQLTSTTSLLGVLGTRQVGLEQYSAASGALNERPVSANEATTVVSIPSIDQFPDRWEGWRPFEALVWTDLEPDLRPSQEAALVEWIRRGGHLVIMLPEAGNPWNLGADDSRRRTSLSSLLPDQPRRDDQVPLQLLMPDLVKSSNATAGSRTISLRVFKDLGGTWDSTDGSWHSVHALDDGRVYAIQRPIGHGLLTIVGVDLTSQIITSLQLTLAMESNGLVAGLPEADRFWNRILGRRADTPRTFGLQALENAKFLNRSRPSGRLDITDRLVSEPIAMSEQAGRGLLLAFVLFLVYWLVAVPGTWYILDRRGLRHLSWPAFFAWGIVFTLIAWGLVEGIQDRSLRVQHLTVLDHVSGEDEQRAVSWLSLYAPGYGERTVELEPETDISSPPRNLLESFSTVDGRSNSFGNSMNIPIDLDRRPDAAIIPGRGTTIDLTSHWMGILDRDEWGRLLQEAPDDPATTRYDAAGRPIGLRGAVISNLPATLEDVQVTWIRSDRLPPQTLTRGPDGEYPWVRSVQAGAPSNRGHAWALGTLEPGDRIELSSLEPNRLNTLSQHLLDTYRPMETNGFDISGGVLNESQRRRQLEALSWYNQLEPPAYFGSETEFIQTGITQRSIGRELDLSDWSTRPAIVITGFLPDSKLPTPLLVDGEPVESSGTTMVRWIIPLPQHDPAAFDL